MHDVGTGFDSLDEALGGLITGDNVVWICDSSELYGRLCGGFVAAAQRNGHCSLLVSFATVNGDGPNGADRAGVEAGAPASEMPGSLVLDAGPSGPFAGPVALADEIDRRVRAGGVDCLVVDDLARPLRRWGPASTIEFFARVCPSMLEAGVTAYWSAGVGFDRTAIDEIRQVTQCLIDVRGGRLRVLKGEGRAPSGRDVPYVLEVNGNDVVATPAPAGGRLARGLLTLRRDLGMTQQEIATVGGVTASAISQAESGTRGLSIDTLLRMSDRLAVPLDRIVNGVPRPTHHLARHDRSRVVSAGITALVADATIGARVYLVDLGPGACEPPVVEHHGVEVIAVSRGLVQVDLGDDRPVLRSGDVVVVETATVRSFRNLRREPAQLFRVLRD